MVKAFFGLPEKVQYCTKCVISNQRPSSTVEFTNTKDEKKRTIFFDQNGVCDACRFAEVKHSEIDWTKREDMLRKTLSRFRRTDGGYDVVVPGSGGKDSAFTSHVLKYKYGMNPLTVTWAPHLYTEIGWQNFTNWIHIGGHDNILFTPNGHLHRYLTKLAFKNLLHPFQPFIIGQRIIGPLIASKFNIQLVMYGENQAEYGNNSDENYSAKMDEKFFSIEEPGAITLGGETIEDIISTTEFNINDFAPYIPPKFEDLKSKNIEVHYLGYYLKWDPQECYYYAVENTGFSSNKRRTPGTYSKYSSIDDKIDMFHYFTTLIKFGIGRATYDAAQEVRNQKITREEAAHLVQKFDQEFPQEFFEDFLKYVDLTQAEFWEIVDGFRSPHIWEKTGDNQKWALKHPIIKPADVGHSGK